MRKLVIATLFAASVNAYALQCPRTLTCDYDAGTCRMDSRFKVISPSVRSAEEVKNMKLRSITASGETRNGPYEMSCQYENKIDPFRAIYIRAFNIKKLIGNGWKHNGFGGRYAICESKNPTLCQAQ